MKRNSQRTNQNLRRMKRNSQRTNKNLRRMKRNSQRPQPKRGDHPKVNVEAKIQGRELKLRKRKII